MHQLIESFLSSNCYCPLPGIGTLKLTENPAHIHPGQNRLSPPSVAVSLIAEEVDSNALLNFIALNEKTDLPAAAKKLKEFCSNLIHSLQSGEFCLQNTGSFYKDDHGNLQFRQTDNTAIYNPELQLVKVVHTKAVHQVRVGDSETTNARMSKYLHESGRVSVNTWGIILILLSLFLLTAIVFYINNPKKLHFNIEDFNLLKTEKHQLKKSGK